MKDWNIKSITSSPYFHQSNGLVESMVKTLKNLIEKSLQLNKPWFYLLQEHRITPISENIPSPVEILFGWRMRSNLSIIPSQLMNSDIKTMGGNCKEGEQTIHYRTHWHRNGSWSWSAHMVPGHSHKEVEHWDHSQGIGGTTLLHHSRFSWTVLETELELD